MKRFPAVAILLLTVCDATAHHRLTPSLQPLPTTQVLFGKPEGMKIQPIARSKSADKSAAAVLTSPVRTDLAVGACYEFKLSGIPGHDGLELRAAVEIPHPGPDVAKYTAHNAAPILFTPADLSCVRSGNVVAKAICLAPPWDVFRGIRTVQLEPEPDPDAVATSWSLDAVVAIVRLYPPAQGELERSK